MTANERPIDPGALPEGTVIGPVRILRAIGAGEQGTVYRGTQLALDRPVAVRALWIEAERTERLRAEGQAAAALSHPHLLPLYALHGEPGLLLHVMRLHEGRLLADRMPLPQRLLAAAQVAGALAALHAAGLAHGRLRAHNVMLTEGGALLADIGLAGLRGGDPQRDLRDLLSLVPELRDAPELAPHLSGERLDGPALQATLQQLTSREGAPSLTRLPAGDTLPARPPASALGSGAPARRSFGKFMLLEQLGQGGMGLVYRARQPDLDREVALKMIQSQSASPTELTRFLREARAAARLRHPNIVAIYEVGEIDLQHYFTMDLVRGPTLAEAVAENRLPIRRALEFVRDVARAVDHAHAQGVLHRDLKPANVLLDESSGRALVADFGLAKDSGAGQAELTGTGAPLGTPAYMSPEQASGRPATAASDIFGIGTVLYHALTGVAPYQGETVMQVMMAATAVLFDPPRQRDPGIDRDVEAICLTAMHPEPERRYASAGELAEDIERFLAGRPILARAPTLRYRLGRWLARRRLLVCAVAITLIFSLSGWWVSARRQAGKLARLAETGRRQAAEAARYRRVQEELVKPLAGRIRETRPFFYIPWIDLRAQLKQLEQELERVQRLARTATYRDSAELWRMLGVGWYLAQRPERAEEALREALRLAPDDAQARLHLGRILLDRWWLLNITRHVDEPVLSRRDGRRLETLLRKVLAQAQASAAGRHDDPMTLYLARTYQALALGREAEAERLCQEGLQKFAGRLGVEEFWRLLAFSVRERPRILAALSRSIAMQPHSANTYYARAEFHKMRKQHKRALADYGRAITLDPRLYMAYVNRAGLWRQLGQNRRARADYDRAIRVAPRRAPAHNNRGILRQITGDLAGARTDYDRAIQIEPAMSRAWYNRAGLNAVEKRYDVAEAEFTRALKLDPDYVNALVDRGVLRRRLGKVELALSDLDRALRLDPHNAKAYNSRANVYLSAGRLRLARRDYDAAIREDPRHARAYNNRAILRRRQGDLKGGLADLNQAIRILPGWHKPYCDRGTFRAQAGDLEGALRDYRKALELAPPGWPDRRSVERAVARLEQR